jgi:hypothetical protein
MRQPISVKISIVTITVLLILTLSGCGKSKYDECMEGHQRLAGAAAQALLDGNEALSNKYQQDMLNWRVTCGQLYGG